MNDQLELQIRPAAQDDFPALAHLLAGNFAGKFAIALGRNPQARARRMELLLPFGIICPGHVYVAYVGDQLAGSFAVRTNEQQPNNDDYRQARQALQAADGWWRAWWGITTLRLLAGPALKPDEAYLDNLVTSQQMQRQGIGQRMVAHMYDTARDDLGKNWMVADVMASNYRVIKFYEKEGWEVTGRNYWIAPITWPLLGTRGIFHIRRAL